MASHPNFPLLPRGGQAGRKLSQALKALRRHRRMRPAEVASAMGMKLRSFEHFEGGNGRLNLERLDRFADATAGDAFAILAGLAIGSPQFAVRCADNKLMTIFLMALQDFDAQVQEDIARLEPRVLIAAFTQLFEELAAEARRGDPFVNDWFARRGPSGGEAPPEEPETA